mmetsp:Transcript_35047/g.41833  ORF Transcript_35047/g.41833 Transcript_35047/m.41833 type:complete len:450 (-) Transcript_35047:326-1675(-)
MSVTTEEETRRDDKTSKQERKKKDKKKSKKRKSHSSSLPPPIAELVQESIRNEEDFGGVDDETNKEKVELTLEKTNEVQQKEVESLHDDVVGDDKNGEIDDDESGDANDRDDVGESRKNPETGDESEKKKKKITKEERATLKLKKKEMKQNLLSQVPKVDKDGISYTKTQIRRMVRRIKNGLHPVATEKEENERRRLLKLEKREEEDELAGMLYENDLDEFGRKRKDREEGDAEDHATEDEGGEDNGDTEGQTVVEGVKSKTSLFPPAKIVEGGWKEPLKKKRRSKPVPKDYVCQACKNEHSPHHWIYDCPYKIRIAGSREVAKKYRGINDPASRKVFVSGLPFDVKAKGVEAYFESEVKGGKVMHCKLFLFDDTKRCKGQGIITFGTDESAKNALKLNGTILKSGTFNDGTEKKKKKGNDVNTEGKKKDLRLGVSKLLNRTVTKGKRG